MVNQHLLTTSKYEVAVAVTSNGFRLESFVCYAFASFTVQINGPGSFGTDTIPLYRLYNPDIQDHFYTASMSEAATAINADGYVSEGIACYVYDSQYPGTTALHRLYNGNINDHFYTTSQFEVNAAKSDGYTYEGIACYVYGYEYPGTTQLYRLLQVAEPSGFYLPLAVFQANTNKLLSNEQDSYINAYVNQRNLAMMPGTSPSGIYQPAENPYYAVAFQSDKGNLCTVIEADSGELQDWGIAMMPGTNPSIAAVGDYDYVIAFQGADECLHTVGADGRPADAGAWPIIMAPGTSPSIAGNVNGSYVIAVQAFSGDLWIVSNNPNYDHGNLKLGMMAGTSPSIAMSIDLTLYSVAFQANTGNLWIIGSEADFGVGDTRQGMMAGTSPGIAILGSWYSGYEIFAAFQANTGHLFTFDLNPDPSKGNVIQDWGWLPMMPGTSPSVAADGVIAFQGSNGNLWTAYKNPVNGAMNLDWGLGMSPGTSPSVAYWIEGYE